MVCGTCPTAVCFACPYACPYAFLHTCLHACLCTRYAVGVGHLLLFLSGFVVMGYIKLWTFSYWVEAKQVAFSEKYGWLQVPTTCVQTCVWLCT